MNQVFDLNRCSKCYWDNNIIKEYLNSKELVDHYNDVHDINKLWWCDKCNIYYHSLDSINYHMDMSIHE